MPWVRIEDGRRCVGERSFLYGPVDSFFSPAGWVSLRLECGSFVFWIKGGWGLENTQGALDGEKQDAPLLLPPSQVSLGSLLPFVS